MQENNNQYNYSEEDFNLDMSELDKKFAGEDKEQNSSEKKKSSGKNSGRDKNTENSFNNKKYKKRRQQIREKRKKINEQQEKNTGISSSAAEKRDINLKFDGESLQKGIIMKEILSSPRSKEPHRVIKQLLYRNR